MKLYKTVLAFTLLVPTACFAHSKTIYKCQIDGQAVFSDRVLEECETEPKKESLQVSESNTSGGLRESEIWFLEHLERSEPTEIIIKYQYNNQPIYD